MAAWGGLYQHLHDAVTARIDQPPQDDMIDVLLAAEIDGEKLAFADVVSNAMLLVQAGLETTASAMSFAYHYLATHPDERDRLIASPKSCRAPSRNSSASPGRSTASRAPSPRKSS